MWTSHLKLNDSVQIGNARIQVLDIGKRRVQISVDTDPQTKILKIPAERDSWRVVEPGEPLLGEQIQDGRR